MVENKDKKLMNQQEMLLNKKLLKELVNDEKDYDMLLIK